MKQLYQGVILSAMVLGLASCNEESWTGVQGEGSISLDLKADGKVADARVGTRAGVQDPIVPAVDDFGIRLSCVDGSYSKTWQSLSEFAGEKSFKAGAYTIEAFYGSLDQEGFEKPCYAGSSQVTVLEARTVPVEITATMASAMVSIDYTDEFRNYFTAYSSAVHSEGHDFITFAPDEVRPAYLTPGKIDINVSFTTPQGKVSLQPASFQALAAHHYHVTFDVNNGGVGVASLQVIFDDSVDAEDVVIDLTDELFSSPAPSLTASGFEPGQTIEVLAGSAPTVPSRWQVMARGGLQECTLTVQSDSYTPAFGSEIELMSATAEKRQLLEACGLSCPGLWKNPDKMALVDFSGFLAHLPEGHHTLTLVAKDRFTRVSEPMSVAVDVTPVKVEAHSNGILFGSDRAVISVAYNGSDPAGKFSFRALDRLGNMKDCEILSSRKSVNSRAFEMQNYEFTISIPDTERDLIPVEVYCHGQLTHRLSLEVKLPSYSLQVDPYATKADIRIAADNADDNAIVVEHLKVYVGGQAVPAQNLTRDTSKGIITVAGLRGSTEYHLQTAVLPLDKVTTENSTDSRFTTESVIQLANGDFSATSPLKFDKLDEGGEFRNTAAIYKQNISSIDRLVPDSWATINSLTCSELASNQNTWFVVPSTYVENGVAVIRNVGYSLDGTTPEKSGNAANSTYYNTNPASFLDSEKVSGELFLGQYSYNGSVNRTDGILFASRPTSLSFDYSYAPLAGDKAEVLAEVLDVSGNVISSAVQLLDSKASMTSVTISFPSYMFGTRASQLRLRFKSSNQKVAPVNIPSGSELNSGATYGNRTVAANEYKAVATGSVLKVDNIKLNY